MNNVNIQVIGKELTEEEITFIKLAKSFIKLALSLTPMDRVDLSLTMSIGLNEAIARDIVTRIAEDGIIV